MIPASDLTTAGTFNLTVVNPGSDSPTSSAVVFSVDNKAPTLSKISPSSAAVGSSSITVTATGTAITSTSVAFWSGTALATTYVSPTSLTFVIPTSDLAKKGTHKVTIGTPGPGGGTSKALTFTVK